MGCGSEKWDLGVGWVGVGSVKTWPCPHPDPCPQPLPCVPIPSPCQMGMVGVRGQGM